MKGCGTVAVRCCDYEVLCNSSVSCIPYSVSELDSSMCRLGFLISSKSLRSHGENTSHLVEFWGVKESDMSVFDSSLAKVLSDEKRNCLLAMVFILFLVF